MTTGGCVDLMVDRHVRAGRGAHTALIEASCNSSSTASRFLTYASLERITRSISAQMVPEGTCGALRIALIGSATIETVAWWLGAMRGGHMVFLVHPELASAQYRALFDLYRPDVVLRDRTARFEMGRLIDPVEPDTGPQTVVPACDLLDPLDGSRMSDSRPALVLASSGSTGMPKLCVHAHRAFWAFERDVSEAMWNLNAGDRVLASGGPYFSFGLQGIHPPLSVGATAVLLPQWQYHSDFLRIIEAERVSVFLAVPTLYHLLQTRVPIQTLRQQAGSLRVAMSAGERLPAVVRQRWENSTGVAMCDSIGTTETFAPYFSELAGREPGLRAVSGFDYEMRFTRMDSDCGESVFMAMICGACMMLGYLGNDGDMVPLKDKFETMDLFMLKESGWQFVSRQSERVKIAGLWVSPQELEEFLLQDEDVVKAAAIPVETNEGLQRLRAYVVPRHPSKLSSGELCARLLSQARSSLRPKALCPDEVHVIEELQSTPTGKFKRAQFLEVMTRASASQETHAKEIAK